MRTRIEKIRTTAFRLNSSHFGQVCLYRPGERFSRTWDMLEKHWRFSNKSSQYRQLPYQGLTTALQVLSGDLILLNRLHNNNKAFIVSRKPVNLEDLAIAMGSWEANVLNRKDRPLSSKLDDLKFEDVMVSDLIQNRKSQCPTVPDTEGWVWQAALWEVAYRFMQTPLETDAGPLHFRMDSESSLLTWDTLIQPDSDDNSAAMHKISFKMITIPGIEEPIASIRSSLVRLAPGWKETGGARYAWAAQSDSDIILRAAVSNFRQNDGSWQTHWKDNAVDVLRGASFHPLPCTLKGPGLNGALRTGYRKQPRYSKIGRGTGIWFHECVAHHARKVLGPEVRGLELDPLHAGRFPTRKKASPRIYLGCDKNSHEPALNLLVVYAGSDVRLRIRNTLAYTLSHEAHDNDLDAIDHFCRQLHTLQDNQPLKCGPVRLQFIKPQNAREFLLKQNKRKDILDWLNTWLPGADKSGSAWAAIIETDASLTGAKNDLCDPKAILRSEMSRQGMVTQFITKDSAPSKDSKEQVNDEKFTDYATANAIEDLMRSAGFFLRPFPGINGTEGNVAVGIYAVAPKNKTTGKKGPQQFLINLVAVELGTTKAWGYIPSKGWSPLNKATAWFLSNDNLMPREKVRRLAENAIEQLALAINPSRTILLLDAIGCRGFWPCLRDKDDNALPSWMTRGNKAVVRVRAHKEEVPCPAGANGWDEGFNPAKFTPFRTMAVSDAQGNAPFFVLSGSAVMDQGKSARNSTRFAAPSKALQKDWHSLGATELFIMEPGEWDIIDLLKSVAMLCRVAPNWQRTLRWPSPLHLARAVVQDHPHAYFEEEDEE